MNSGGSAFEHLQSVHPGVWGQLTNLGDAVQCLVGLLYVRIKGLRIQWHFACHQFNAYGISWLRAFASCLHGPGVHF